MGMDVLIAFSVPPEQRGWIAMVVALACIAWLLFRPRFKKGDPLERHAYGSLSQQASVERQMQSLLVELSEMTRAMTAKIDTRAARLEELVKQADERIATLRQMELTLPHASARPTFVPDHAIPDNGPIPIDPRHAEIYSLADQGQAAREIASRLGRPSGEVELILALRQRSA